MSTLYVQTKTSSSFWLSVLSVPTLISHYLSSPILSSGPLTSFSSHLLLTFSPCLSSPLLLMMCFDLFSFVIWVVCRFLLLLFFILSFFVCLFPFFLSLVTIDRPFFCAIFSADSLWFMCPSSQPPEGHQGQAQKTQAVKHLFLLSLKSFSLLSSLTCVSFFSPHLPVILLCLYCRSCSVSSPSPSPIIHHSLAHFVPLSLVCFPFRLSAVISHLVSVVSQISSPLLYSSIRTRHPSGLFNVAEKNVGQFERLFTELKLFGFLALPEKNVWTQMRILLLSEFLALT